MWTFIASITIFTVLVACLGLWQRRTWRTVKHVAHEVDQQIHVAAEVAQRRHVQRFGRMSTDLTHTLNGAHPTHSKS